MACLTVGWALEFRQTLLPQYESVLYSPGKGSFAVESDRAKIAGVAKQMLWKKLIQYLEHPSWFRSFLLFFLVSFFFDERKSAAATIQGEVTCTTTASSWINRPSACILSRWIAGTTWSQTFKQALIRRRHWYFNVKGGCMVDVWARSKKVGMESMSILSMLPNFNFREPSWTLLQSLAFPNLSCRTPLYILWQGI